MHPAGSLSGYLSASPVLLVVFLLSACGHPESPEPVAEVARYQPPPDGSRSRPFPGRGVIIEIRGDIIQIAHETIPGFMAAVTMDFPLADPALAGGLVPGDTVEFSIQVIDAWSHQIVDIKRAE